MLPNLTGRAYNRHRMVANDLLASVDPGPDSRRIWQLQVGLRTLHYGVLVGGILLAVAEAIGLMGTLGLALLCLLVVLHVLGNSLGTRLNRESSRHAVFEEFDPALFPSLGDWRAEFDPAHENHLAKRTPCGWLVVGATCLGMIAGGVLGGLFFAREPKLAGMIVGTVSSVILGGFFGFAASSFSKVVLVALHQAKAEAGSRTRTIAR